MNGKTIISSIERIILLATPTLDEIKSRIDIVDLVSEAGVKLRHAGKNYTGFCPFHDNKHSPAFVAWPVYLFVTGFGERIFDPRVQYIVFDPEKEGRLNG